ncbi:MAG: hypothetical protein V3V16_06250 [Melioribacteraceae bacterium]
MKNIALLIILVVITSCSSFKNEQKNFHKGYFSYFADVGLFVDCETNEKYPVAMEGDYLALEKEYLEMAKITGEKIIVTLNGKIEKRNKMEGVGKRNFLVVKKFIGMFPNKNCK